MGLHVTLGTDVIGAGFEDSLEGKGLESREEFEDEEGEWILEGFTDLVCGLS